MTVCALDKGTEFSPFQITERRSNADVIFAWMTPIANECGYALARHGSGVRDIDLIAVPWIEDAKSPTDLVLELCSRLTLIMGNFDYRRPHGRAAFAMWHSDWADHQIDLSVIKPRDAEAPSS